MSSSRHAVELALQGYEDPHPHLLARVREHLAECQDDAAVCLVCLETIGPAGNSGGMAIPVAM